MSFVLSFGMASSEERPVSPDKTLMRWPGPSTTCMGHARMKCCLMYSPSHLPTFPPSSLPACLPAGLPADRLASYLPTELPNPCVHKVSRAVSFATSGSSGQPVLPS